MAESVTANVLCPSLTGFVADDLVRAMRDDAGIVARIVMPIPGRHGSAIMAVENFNILVMVEDRPLPQVRPVQNNEVERGARSALLDHNCHATVTLLNVPEEQAEKMRAVLRLAQVASAVARCAGGSAVLWSDSGTLVPFAQFRTLTARWAAAPDEIPLLLICRVSAYRDGEDSAGQTRHGVFSVGLRSFIGREVELVPQSTSFENAVQCFDRVANHLLKAGKSFRDGDSFILSPIQTVDMRLGADRSGEVGSLILCDVKQSGQTANASLH